MKPHTQVCRKGQKLVPKAPSRLHPKEKTTDESHGLRRDQFLLAKWSRDALRKVQKQAKPHDELLGRYQAGGAPQVSFAIIDFSL